MAVELPCDADGMCMVCKVVPEESKVLVCNGCASPWHMGCLTPPLENVPTSDWFCPDCNLPPASDTAAAPAPAAALPNLPQNDLIIGQIRAIQNDPSLSAQEKARKCQDLMSKAPVKTSVGEAKKGSSNKMLDIFDENLNCTFCMQIADRPVTTPCGHNFCLKCFQRWIGQGKKTCGKCRSSIPPKMMSNPRINSALVIAIRMAKAAVNPSGTSGPPKPYQYIQNKDRPDKAYTTDRAKKTGKANASSGKIFVTTPPDHFGPITAENDPVRGQGVLVGETWEDRLECRQWGAHLPHVAGIAGQSDYGSQSVALSGGYEDDEDHGEWFLYTGSGGRDLSGNKRTNNKQSFDQKFEKLNKALRVSCKNGYPVRVVRSHKEKRSSYAPESGVRYDGVYRIEKCWRKVGMQGFRVCRYLFVRCDNEPAPWTSDEHGDRPRPLPKIDELKGAVEITERKSSPSWDWKEETECWEWTKPAPISRKAEEAAGGPKSSRKAMSFGQRLLKEFGCDLCRKVLSLPISAPCGHNFCKSCLDAAFKGQEDIRQRTGVGGRSLRAQKVVKRCPSCQGDITDFLVNPQVNRQMEEVIQSLRKSGEADESDGEDASAGKEKEDDESAAAKGGTHKAKDQSSDEKCETSSVIVQGNEELDQEVEQKDGSEDDSSTKVSNVSNLSTVVKPEVKSVLDPVKEKAFQNLCAKYTDYSEDLLRSMLADQDGDVMELDYLLKALHRNQKKASRMKAAATDGEDSSSQVEPSGITAAVKSPVKKSPAKRKKSRAGGASSSQVEPSRITAAVKSPVKKSPAKRKRSRASGSSRPQKRQETEVESNSDDEVLVERTATTPLRKSLRKRRNEVEPEKSPKPKLLKKLGVRAKPLQVDSDTDFE